MPWASRPVPIYIAAAGPRALRLAGRVADGAIIGAGVLPEVIDASLAEIRAGAAEAGRDWRDLDLWWLAGCRIEEGREVAEDAMLALTAALVNAHFRTSLDGKLLPDDLRQEAAHLVARYDYSAHVRHDGLSPNAALLAGLPRLRAYASARWLIGGSPSECIEQLEASAEAGARQFWWTASFPDKMEFVDRFGEFVLRPLAHPAKR